jgi:hypothetical protein
MSQAYSPDRRTEGNVYRIPTQFATRLRMLVIWEARREARQAVIRKLKAEGVRVSLMSASEITQVADAHLREHAAELLAKAEASRVVHNLRHVTRKKSVDPAAKSACGNPVQNGEGNSA